MAGGQLCFYGVRAGGADPVGDDSAGTGTVPGAGPHAACAEGTAAEQQTECVVGVLAQVYKKNRIIDGMDDGFLIKITS
ncbi:hypothetical protein ACIF83_35600 [Streptomyces sp. NPDC085866]|uniref:hypothetical protein n=1 Tax=Streptomyces sp. NPDC085866 TaxID=3365736 RepID=UPI0037D57768